MSALLENLFSLRDKTALVTGASGGIGSAIATAFAEAGAIIGLNGNSADKLSAVQRTIDALGGKSVVLQRDLQTVGSCRGLVQEALQELGRIDILVNCAGVNRRKPIREVTEEDYDFIANINLKSVFFLSQQVSEIMRRTGGGKIINIGSVTSTDGLGGISVYGATKSAIAQLTKTMALEWAADNIQVNCLAPGFIMTPLTEVGLWGDAHRKQWLLERIPARRPGEPADLLGAALLLASGASAYISGQIINVDGGYLAGGSWLQEGS
jgi:gluconate 5-dehydrogenase